ncbi:MAG: nuclear transport factor 2 family protein [Pseudomonadota bacterium]
MSVRETAFAFFDACETGKGWEECAQYCQADAPFRAQSGALAEVTTLEAYAEWMKGMFGPLPNASYELLSFGVDEERSTVCAAAIFHGTHWGKGGPVPATGQSTASDYAYVMTFEDGKVASMIKIWNDGIALGELGWV